MRVLYFAWVKEKAGIAAEEIDPPAEVATIAELIDWLKARGPRIRERLRALRGDPRGDRPEPCAPRRQDQGRARDRLLPAGHRRLTMIRVQQEDFDIAAEIAALKAGRSDIGAIVSFIGTVRDQHGALSEMTLEHYPGMTETELARIEQEAQARWPLQASLIVHRVGTLQPGDNIVLVITASEHRDAAFDAAKFLMDYLKTSAPLWKRESGRDGARWVEADAKDDSAAARWTKKHAAE